MLMADEVVFLVGLTPKNGNIWGRNQQLLRRQLMTGDRASMDESLCVESIWNTVGHELAIHIPGVAAKRCGAGDGKAGERHHRGAVSRPRGAAAAEGWRSRVAAA